MLDVAWSIVADPDTGATICRSGDIEVVACGICGVRPLLGRATCGNKVCMRKRSDRRKLAKRDLVKPPIACIECGETFRQRSKDHVRCAKPSCREKAADARKSKNNVRAAAWYKQNKDRHKKNVLAARRKRQNAVTVADADAPLLAPVHVGPTHPHGAEMPRGARGRFFITPYAVRRFIQRIRPDLSSKAALEMLIALASASRCKGPYNGKILRDTLVRPELWRGPRVGTKGEARAESRIRFVVSHGPGELPQVVTVLPRRSGRAEHEARR